MLIGQENITAVILAGGKGSRLGGQDKGLVHYQNKPLIEHLLERITPQVASVIISANRNCSIYAGYGYPVIKDTISDYQGPLAGFSSAMSIAKTDYIITLPCDGPLISNDLVARLQNCLQKNPSKIAVAYDGQRLQPTYALIPINWLSNLNQYLDNGGRKIYQWYAENNAIHCDFSDSPEIFTNINTEKQLRYLL